MNQESILPVKLPQQAYDDIVAHAREGKPEEICGILRGGELEAYEAIRGVNVAEERIENYTVDPKTLLMQFKFEEAGEEMMGIYHSHPVSVAYPSATDAWNAHYPDSIYFICSLEFDDAPVIRAFRMTPHWIDFDLAKLQSTLSFYETRPGLFAYYQPAPEETEPAHDALVDIVTQVPAPFYVVYYTPDSDGDDSSADAQIVSIVEHPLELY
ncbi:MAG: M67 family metallopeptidase [Chloroflexota bacterium]